MTEQEKQARAMGGETVELRLQQALNRAALAEAALAKIAAKAPFTVAWHEACGRIEQAEAALKLATERNAALLEALDPFLRVFSINAPLNLTDSTPVRDVIPGVWPTWGDLCKLAAAAKEGA